MQRPHSLEKTLMLWKIEGRRRSGQEDEMLGWHPRHNGHESEQALGDSEEGQGRLACWSSWGRKESDTTSYSGRFYRGGNVLSEFWRRLGFLRHIMGKDPTRKRLSTWYKSILLKKFFDCAFQESSPFILFWSLWYYNGIPAILIICIARRYIKKKRKKNC